ncbi:30S ribosomal protein THX [Algoriphagus sp. AGSA1]|nr:30S ribosomal protein THX [Algoriphagus sp. AGSA1]
MKTKRGKVNRGTFGVRRPKRKINKKALTESLDPKKSNTLDNPGG